MISIYKDWVGGFMGALRGMRNPYMSHVKGDSRYCDPVCNGCGYIGSCGWPDVTYDDERFYIGDADMALCKKLIKAGPEHRKFLRMIHVQADVLAPRYWWVEMDKYKYVEANSSSTMHLITKRELTIDDFSSDDAIAKASLNKIIPLLNHNIKMYEASKHGADGIKYFRTIKQLLPESYNQLRTIDTNYECLLSIYHQRHAHNLPEWHEFCEWIGGLPYMGDFLEAME